MNGPWLRAGPVDAINAHNSVAEPYLIAPRRQPDGSRLRKQGRQIRAGQDQVAGFSAGGERIAQYTGEYLRGGGVGRRVQRRDGQGLPQAAYQPGRLSIVIQQACDRPGRIYYKAVMR